MSEQIDTISIIADRFGAIVLDQWGVLHDGTHPYPNAITTVERLAHDGHRLAVLSNSGKRSDINLDRIVSKGFPRDAFETVMTSGEALWRDLDSGHIPARKIFPIAAQPEDVINWAKGLDVCFVQDLSQAEAVLLMGLPFEGDARMQRNWLEALIPNLRASNLPIYCSNPDRKSPRAGGRLVISPGALADDLQKDDVPVQFYGKPHRPVFRALERALDLPPQDILMVGDSLEHDIAGAHSAGWSSLFIQGGIHRTEFETGNAADTLANIAKIEGARLPTFTITELC